MTKPLDRVRLIRMYDKMELVYNCAGLTLVFQKGKVLELRSNR